MLPFAPPELPAPEQFVWVAGTVQYNFSLDIPLLSAVALHLQSSAQVVISQ